MPLSYAPGETTEDLIKQGRITPASYSGLPGLPLGKVAENLSSAAAGQLPPDVLNLLAQHAAELGVSSGTSGSEFNKFRSLRDLGLTSLDREDFATKAVLPFFKNQADALASDNEAYQNRVAAQRRAAGPLGVTNSAPLLQPRSNPNTTRNPMSGAGRMNPTSEVDSILADLGQRYGPGRGGMAPMGSGTIPGGGGSWNAGPLDTGQGTFFAGDPSEMSTYDLGALGFPDFGNQSMLSGLSDDDYFDLAGLPLPAQQEVAGNPMTEDDYDYTLGTG